MKTLRCWESASGFIAPGHPCYSCFHRTLLNWKYSQSRLVWPISHFLSSVFRLLGHFNSENMLVLLIFHSHCSVQSTILNGNADLLNTAFPTISNIQNFPSSGPYFNTELYHIFFQFALMSILFYLNLCRIAAITCKKKILWAFI